MDALFVANIELKNTEGIYKKVSAQSDAIGNNIGNCKLITRKGKNAVVKEYLNESPIETNDNYYKYIINQLLKENVKVIYIRHMIPSFNLIKILRVAKKKKIKIYYEIPTYPYFGEQFKASRRKYRAIVKILLDVFFWPIIYAYIDKLVVIKSNTKTHFYKKMVEITNGALTEKIQSKKLYNARKDYFSMVTVGTLYPYHGYDRVLNGLKECNEVVDGKIVEINIIGSSYTIDKLKETANELGLKHVKFLGVKNSEELNQLFENYDVGLGCLALHRRNADIDTTLKIIEYYCRGITVVTSGVSPMDKYNKDITIHIKDGEDAINIKDLYEEYIKINTEDNKKISLKAKEVFSWNSIMNTLFEEEKRFNENINK